jgi:hypothetical protein
MVVKMIKFLVGYTGFVGSNINNEEEFDGVFNSKNIADAYGKEPDLLIYSGIKAEKFLANNNPEKDFKDIEEAINNIKLIKPKKIVLISTVDVYKNPINVDEDTIIEVNELHPYGLNRYYLEEWVRNNIDEHLIVRLPALFGINIKKNFIYDMIKVIPNMLKKDKFEQLRSIDSTIQKYYYDNNNGFYKCNDLDENQIKELKEYFNKINFSAINFTDSRTVFQFYNLKYLWSHINIALENNIKTLNIATEPISASELYEYIYNKPFDNQILDNPIVYNYKTKYYKIFNGYNKYIFNKEIVMKELKEFVLKSK